MTGRSPPKATPPGKDPPAWGGRGGGGVRLGVLRSNLIGVSPDLDADVNGSAAMRRRRACLLLCFRPA